jgi:magnesium transporter
VRKLITPLDADEDLSAMYLSAKMAHQPRGLTDHEELELLLESFSKQVEEIVSELDTLTVSSYPFICCSERRH